MVSSGNEALSHGAAYDFAVITIDRMLPDLDGIAVMRQLRDGGVAALFLIISALGEVDDEVRGFRAGGKEIPLLPKEFQLTSSAQRRPRRVAGDVAAARLGSSFRSIDEYH